jgi:hypothetical protein
MRVSYDPKCEELARYFLTSETSIPDNDQVNRLAGVIQAAIEMFWVVESSGLQPPG